MDFSAYKNRLLAIYGAMDDPDQDPGLRAPANTRALEKLDATMRGCLDPALREAWTVADGGGSYAPVFARPGFLTGLDFLTIEDALDAREAMARRAPQYRDYEAAEPRDARIRAGWFEPGWLPFAAFGGATLLFLSDGSPSANGKSGQILAFVHDPDEIVHVAPSFAEFLDLSIEALQDCIDDD
jgi:cell wall assembly regulator SMI1